MNTWEKQEEADEKNPEVTNGQFRCILTHTFPNPSFTGHETITTEKGEKRRKRHRAFLI